MNQNNYDDHDDDGLWLTIMERRFITTIFHDKQFGDDDDMKTATMVIFLCCCEVIDLSVAKVLLSATY